MLRRIELNNNVSVRGRIRKAAALQRAGIKPDSLGVVKQASIDNNFGKMSALKKFLLDRYRFPNHVATFGEKRNHRKVC